MRVPRRNIEVVAASRTTSHSDHADTPKTRRAWQTAMISASGVLRDTAPCRLEANDNGKRVQGPQARALPQSCFAHTTGNLRGRHRDPDAGRHRQTSRQQVLPGPYPWNMHRTYRKVQTRLGKRACVNTRDTIGAKTSWGASATIACRTNLGGMVSEEFQCAWVNICVAGPRQNKWPVIVPIGAAPRLANANPAMQEICCVRLGKPTRLGTPKKRGRTNGREARGGCRPRVGNNRPPRTRVRTKIGGS